MNPLSLQANSVILEDVSAQRGDLRVLQAQLNLKDQEITAIKSRFLPTLNAVYNVNWTAAEPGKLNPFRNPEPNTAAPRAQTLALSVSMPIFQGFKRTADVQRAKIERKDIEWQTYEATLAARNQIETEREQLNLSFQTADARLRALSQSRRGYDIALARFQNGMGSQLEVTEAESQVREAELNYASMVFNYLVAKARFDLATGYVPYIDTHHQDPN